MELVIFNTENVRELDSFEAEFAFGADENRFTLVVGAEYAPSAGDYVAIDKTELGGIVDEVTTKTDTPGIIQCSGRTWHGVLAGKMILPPSGSAYKTVSGEPSKIIKDLITGFALPFKVETTSFASISYQFNRFIDAYTGIKSMLADNGYKLVISFLNGDIYLKVETVETLANEVVSDVLDFTMTTVRRSINHLVCAGKGELEQREVIHLYADAKGRISKKQTFKGIDEITAFYDNNNSEGSELESDGIKRFKELISAGSVEADVHDGFNAYIGDIVEAQDTTHRISVSAEITKKIVKITDGVETVSYEIGTPTTTKVRR